MDDIADVSEDDATDLRAAVDDQLSRLAMIVEANHRIANNLSIIGVLVQGQARELANETRLLSAPDVARLLREVSRRIDMVGRLHRLLAHRPEDDIIDLGEYLHQVAVAAMGSMESRGDVTFERVQNDRCDIHADRALLVGIVVGELLTNALKYAYPNGARGKIRLTCARADGVTRVTLADDGVGLSDGFYPYTGGGMGLRIARLLTKQLKGLLLFRSSALGLTVELVLR